VKAGMRMTVTFYSFFKDLTGCEQAAETLPEGSTLGDLMQVVRGRFPKLAPLQAATLMAVGLEYQNRDYVLKEGDEVSLFPPVQGG
jgi:molybdopterin converting factor small subunit